MAGEFSGIENAQGSMKLPNFSPGTYVLEAEAIKLVDSRTKGKLFITEWKILESTGPQANPPGTRASDVVKMSLDTALGHVKNVASALLGVPEKSVTQKRAEELVANEKLARGVKVRAEAHIIAKKNGDPFTLITYRAL